MPASRATAVGERKSDHRLVTVAVELKRNGGGVTAMSPVVIDMQSMKEGVRD
jgi:hypothetical protein